MPCVRKPTSTHIIIISLWLIRHIQCGFSISYLSIPGIGAHEICNISHVFAFSFQLYMVLCLLLLFWFYFVFNSLCKCMVSVSCPLIFFLCDRIKNNSPILCQLFWPTSSLWQQLLEMFLKLIIFSFIWESVSKIHEKCGTIGVRS